MKGDSLLPDESVFQSEVLPPPAARSTGLSRGIGRGEARRADKKLAGGVSHRYQPQKERSPGGATEGSN
jgi:hypothetical protein